MLILPESNCLGKPQLGFPWPPILTEMAAAF